MTQEQKIELITRNLEEVITQEDVGKLIESNVPLIHYIGFEISGLIHLGTGLCTMLKVKDLQEAGVETRIFLADWHTWINRKLGGADLETIKQIAVRFFKEGMTAAALCTGAEPSKITFILGSDLYHENDVYWQTVIDVSKNTTLARIQRSITITGKSEGESVDFAILIYPAMQVADIFIQGVSLAHAGMDQRKAHVIMRDVAGSVTSQNQKLQQAGLKPVAIHHHLLLGLGKPPVWPIPADMDKHELWSSFKMSKSKPKSAVFLTDSPEEIRKKVNEAFCPEGEIEFNPVLDWTKHIVFPIEKELLIERLEKYGGNKKYSDYKNLEKDFSAKQLHPQDLKTAVAEGVVRILKPARDYLSAPSRLEMVEEMKRLVGRTE